MRVKTLVCCLAILNLPAGAACTSSSSGGSAGDANAAIAAACADTPSTYCVPAPDSGCSQEIECGLAGLPNGLACSGSQACKMAINPCSGGGGARSDGYICACVNGAWACGRCSEGLGECSGPSDARSNED